MEPASGKGVYIFRLGLKRRDFLIKKISFSIVLLGLLLGIVSCTTIDVVSGQKTRNMYTVQEDVKLGSDVYNSTIKQMREKNIPINADSKRLTQLREMVARISAVSHLPDLPYEVALLGTNIVNAMAAPGGKIMVFEGLWDPEKGLVRDDQELAAVLAHEIAHVNCRHTTESMTRKLPISLAFSVGSIYAESKDKEDLAKVLGGAFLAYEGLVTTYYSREDEREADREGLLYMAKAGYDPEAALRIWQRVSEEGPEGHSPVSFFSTHPGARERVAQIKQLLPRARKIYEERTSE